MLAPLTKWVRTRSQNEGPPMSVIRKAPLYGSGLGLCSPHYQLGSVGFLGKNRPRTEGENAIPNHCGSHTPFLLVICLHLCLWISDPQNSERKDCRPKLRARPEPSKQATQVQKKTNRHTADEISGGKIEEESRGSASGSRQSARYTLRITRK